MRNAWAVLAATTALLACLLPSTALGHAGNPNFESQLRGLATDVDGVDVGVLNYDDSIQLINRSGKTVVVYGYAGEPYARLLPDGTVEVNANSPATYLNEDRFADAPVPKRADPDAAPEWRPVSEDGRFSWHDHRIHWMGEGTPPQVEDESRRTKVFDYSVPIRVGDERDTIEGTLFWIGPPDPSKAPFFIGAAVLVLLGAVAVVVVRRRRGGGSGGDDGTGKEAW